MLGQIVTVIVDRPKGSTHPNYLNLIYPINYGYIKNVIAGDNEEQDAYIIGVDIPLKEFTGKVIAIIHRLDDIEDKLVVAPENTNFTKKEIKELTDFQEQYFNIKIIM